MEMQNILSDLNNPKIKTATGNFPAFFAVLQTAVNQTTWKGSDLEMVSHVKGQLERLRQVCAELSEPEVKPEEPKAEGEEAGVEISVPPLADPEHSAPAEEVSAPVEDKPKEPMPAAVDEKKK